MNDSGSIPDEGSDGILSLRHRVQTGSVVHPASYTIDSVVSFPEVKVAWAWS